MAAPIGKSPLFERSGLNALKVPLFARPTGKTAREDDDLPSSPRGIGIFVLGPK
jgi:hypothetical protein